MRRTKPIPPLAIRRMRAEMALRHLSLSVVARRARVPYAIASQILNGRKVDADRLAALHGAILHFPVSEATV